MAGLSREQPNLPRVTHPILPPRPPKSSEQPRLKQRGETDEGAELAIMV